HPSLARPALSGFFACQCGGHVPQAGPRPARPRHCSPKREESDPELLEVLDAYSFPRVRLDALLRELWPCLDSLLRRVLPPRIVTRGAPLVFDSFLELSFAGIRSLESGCRQLRYKSDTLL